MSTHKARLKALRAQLVHQHLDGFVVPLTDEHMSEYVGEYAQRLAWLTGFQGSAGSVVVLRDKAAIFVDGRYTLQVRDQVDGADYEYLSVPETSVAEWLGGQVVAGDRIGYDAWLHTRGWVKAAAAAVSAHGAELVAVDSNAVDAIWADRPAPSSAPAEVHPLSLSGQSAEDKRAAIADALKAKQADAVVIAALDSLAWAFNLRGQDVARTPVVLAFAIVHADASADLYIDRAKVNGAVAAHLGAHVRLHPRDDFAPALDVLGQSGKRVAADPASCVSAIFQRLEAAGASVIEMRDPCVLPKAIKNDTEIAGTIAAHVRDGAALTRFLRWFAVEAPNGGLDELTVADRLEAFRRDTGMLRDLSFDTISGAGPNGAIVHYRASPDTNRRIESDSLFLLDSGGQYPDGTTDVTRTIAVGTPTAEMKDRFTRVLKGHIAIATIQFPKGTRGSQLDVLARQFLWSAGIDYAHGTGHGVGSYLSVHEGPQRISAGGAQDEPLAVGMILSNEPGYYKAGAWGIRIENLERVVAREVAGAEKPMLGFAALTLAPIDLALVDRTLLTDAERDWLNGYHAEVRDTLSPMLDDDVRQWLAEATRAI